MKCWICGKDGATRTRGFGYREIYGLVPYEGQRHYCDECLNSEQKRLEKEKQEYVRIKVDMMIERALRIIEKCDMDMYEYEEEIRTVQEFAKEHPEKFKSAYEIVTAIMLLWNRVDMKINYKVGRKFIDFYIPEYKIALEIDGEQHANKKYTDSQRDEILRGKLGKGWEIVRISTKYVEENPELLWEATKEVKKKKTELRRQYGGEIPHWYDHKKYMKKPKKEKVGDDNLFGI